MAQACGFFTAFTEPVKEKGDVQHKKIGEHKIWSICCFFAVFLRFFAAFCCFLLYFCCFYATFIHFRLKRVLFIIFIEHSSISSLFFLHWFQSRLNLCSVTLVWHNDRDETGVLDWEKGLQKNHRKNSVWGILFL